MGDFSGRTQRVPRLSLIQLQQPSGKRPKKRKKGEKERKKEGGKSRLKETETERVTRRQEKKTNE